MTTDGATPLGAHDSAARTCVSSDGEALGTIVGIQRDPTSGAARWMVVSPPNDPSRHLFIPVQQAVPRRDGLHLPFAAERVRSAPTVADHTRMTLAEEERLASHYALPQAPVSSVVHDSEVQMTRSEEVLEITSLEWRPYSRVRVRKVVRSEEVTSTVTVRREELIIEDEPVSAVERLEIAFGIVRHERHEPIDMVLHREEVVVQKRTVAYERVRVDVVSAEASWTIEESLRKERIEVERQPLHRDS